VVDDDPSAVRLVREALAAAGYSFFEAHDGPGALAAIREHHPDLVIMDVEMPGLSGVEVCRIVKANQESTFGFLPIILMTVRAGGSKVEGLELGADDFVAKPFDRLELSARVKSMLRLKALQDALVEKNRELDQKREELLLLSRTDPLTDLYNRRYFQERLDAEFARSRRYHVPLSCLMLDVDHFKRLNDTHGHSFGDEVLRRIAHTLRATLRQVDLCARYGGEELVALLPETAPPDARFAAERVRASISALELRAGPDLRVPVTASVGVATYPAPDIDSAERLVRTADDRLYEAKAKGRNRVEQHRG
jgi:diguanylate cyclase (GGDEF)-like protein